MNSSKTANLLMVAHNYKNQNKKVILIKPKCDTRFGENNIKSRAFENGMEADIILDPKDNNLEQYLLLFKNPVAILVDECQFLSRANIDCLRNCNLDIPVICYGLRTDYTGQLFSGSLRLMAIADTIEEIKTVCVWCNNKATINAKYLVDESGNKTVIRNGSTEIDLGAEEKYIPLCWNCWK
jgi:thymidine kinase